MEKQLRLFNVSLPEKRLSNKPRKPLFYIEIIEKGELFVFWKRAWHLGQAKKLAAMEYNTHKGYIKTNFVNFRKAREEKETRTT